VTIAVLLLLRETIKTHQTIDQDFLISSSRGFVSQHKLENSEIQNLTLSFRIIAVRVYVYIFGLFLSVS